MAATTTQMLGVLYVNYKNFGWSEKFNLPEDNYAAAVLKMALICAWRAAMLAPGCVIEWARVSIAGNPKEAMAAIDRPLPSLFIDQQNVGVGPVNDPEVALHFRLETADGKHADRLVRGINDLWVRDTLIDPLLAPLTPLTPLPLLEPNLNNLAVIRSFMQVLLANTVHARRQAGVPPTYVTTDWARIIYRGVTNRKTGRPFGMSRGRAPIRA